MLQSVQSVKVNLNVYVFECFHCVYKLQFFFGGGTPWKWGTGMCSPEVHFHVVLGVCKIPILFFNFHDPTFTPKSQISIHFLVPKLQN